MATSPAAYKRQVNNLRFLYRELEIVEEIIEEATPGFLKYYQDFCKNHDINPQDGPPGTELPSEEELPEIVGGLMSGSAAPSKEYHNDEYGNWHAKEEPEAIEESDMHKAFSKIFKKIAYHLHPDRQPPTLTDAQKQKKLKMFRKTLDALENKHYFQLMIITEQFDIETPDLSEEQQKWLKQEISIVREKLAQLQSTYNYHFSQSHSEHQKEQLMKSFVLQNFGIKI